MLPPHGSEHCSTQLAPVGADHVPFVQLKVAPPVTGAVLSVAVTEPPWDTAPVLAEQVLPLTVQVWVLPAHCCTQLPPPWSAQLPLLQRKLREPVVGWVESVTAAAGALCAAASVVPLQVLPEMVQLTASAVQLSTQLALLGADHVPLVQLKVALPVTGAALSVATVEPP